MNNAEDSSVVARYIKILNSNQITVSHKRVSLTNIDISLWINHAFSDVLEIWTAVVNQPLASEAYIFQ